MIKLGVKQINFNEIFNNDKKQILRKRELFNKYSENIMIQTNSSYIDIIEWFKFKINSKYLNMEDICLNIAEDLCIVQKDGSQYKMIFGFVAFPNRWRLIEKINKNIGEIHNPIPNFDKTVIIIGKFFDMLTEKRYFRRENIGFTNTDELYLPYSEQLNINKNIYERKEIQTFIKVNDKVIFLIKTEINKISKEEYLKKSNNISNQMKEYKLISKL